MSSIQLKHERGWRLIVVIVAFTSFSLIQSFKESAKESAHTFAKDEPQSVYSPDPNDPWNRIFYNLFTRTVSYRLTDESREGAPFITIEVIGFPQGLAVSSRLFQRLEIGDRAIEPFYPSFITSAGLREALNETHFSQLKQSLIEAINDDRPRTGVQRALMQGDVWAAYDLLAGIERTRITQLNERASQLLPLFARFIKKLALTPTEVESLPDNYALAAKHHRLPGLFSPDSGWIEIQWIPNLEHDSAAGFRRTGRVFVKPNQSLADKQKFLDRLRDSHGDSKELGAVALVIQNLLLDREGNIAPTRLTYDVQIRTFERDATGEIIRTELKEYEMSRKLLVMNPETGGLISLGESDPMYLPIAGNDYGFATPHRDKQGETSPVLGTLRMRCGICHGRPNAPTVFTFNRHTFEAVPPVEMLRQPNDTHARYVAGQKAKREDFNHLKIDWARK